MCGIVGLRLKASGLQQSLGELVAPMLEVLESRGPDSTGLAMYCDDPMVDQTRPVKYSLCAPTASFGWEALSHGLGDELGCSVAFQARGQQGLVFVAGDPRELFATLHRLAPEIRVFGWGSAIEVLKDVGTATDVCERYGVHAMSGYQAIGHTRMATESAVTIEHSHPFAVASDLALVHNGSFSNYATVRRDLEEAGVRFDTDNDSEVAARFIGTCLDEGADLTDALRGVLKTFDGFFTLLVSTADAMAVVRDSFACKPLVVAETETYVAVASESVALAHLPGIEDADLFEPRPEEVYPWTT